MNARGQYGRSESRPLEFRGGRDLWAGGLWKCRIPSNRGWNQILEMADKETTQKSGAEIGIPDREDGMSKGERDEK